MPDLDLVKNNPQESLTVDPNFEHMVKFLKERDIHIAVVTNGSGMKKIRNVAHLFGRERLSSFEFGFRYGCDFSGDA